MSVVDDGSDTKPNRSNTQFARWKNLMKKEGTKIALLNGQISKEFYGYKKQVYFSYRGGGGQAMSEELLLDSITNDEFGTEGLTEAEGREIAEGNLVPKGKWQGQLQPDSKVSVVETESGEHPLEGEKVARCHVILDTEAGEKHLFFDAIGKKVTATSKKGGLYTVQASTNGNMLYRATKLYGHPFTEVLKAAQERRLVYSIGIKKGNDDYPQPQNTVKAISAIAEE